MLRLLLPERSSFPFERKSNTPDEREQLKALQNIDIELKLPPHIPLPMVHHTSTKSLFDLFNDDTAYDVQIKKNGNTILSPLSAKSMPNHFQTPTMQTRSVSPFDALGSHGDPTKMAPVPSPTVATLQALGPEHEQSTASTPSSGFREEDDGSGCSRKSSTSSIGTPMAGHKSYFEAMATLEKQPEVLDFSQPQIQQLPPPQPSMLAPKKPNPQYDKPLPPPPSPERLFSVSSALSILRAESVLKYGQQQSMQMVADAPVIFRRQSQMRPSHGRSASDDVLRYKRSKTSKAVSPDSSPKSKRGARLGAAMNQGCPHSRAQTLSNINFQAASSPPPKRPRPLSLKLDTAETLTLREEYFAADPQVIEEPTISISPSAAEKVVFKIMRRLDDPVDVLAAASVNRGFYVTFKRGERQLVHELLLRQCPPAWEFQSNTSQASGEPLSFRAYTKDKAALTFVKSALLAHGDSKIQPGMTAGLIGADITQKSRVDAALWRIWTFCKGFGHRSLLEDDLAIQVDWLNGGRIARKRQIKTAVGRGNGAGLATADLEDLLELWDIIGAMLLACNLSIAEARAVGLFNKCDIDEIYDEEWFLEEWYCYIRSLGLPAVLSISSATSFEQAQASGFTEWTPPAHGQTRSTFFRAAVTSVYQERLLAEAATKATQFALPPRSQHRPTASDASISSLEQLTRAFAKSSTKLPPPGLKIDKNPTQVRRKPLSPSLVVDSHKTNSTWQPETPDTPFPMQSLKDREADASDPSQEQDREPQRDSLTSPTSNSVVLQSLGMTATASTKLGATLFPMEYPPTSPQIPVLFPITYTSVHQCPPRKPTNPTNDEPAVIDPADKAMKLLTQDMGFSAADASRALAKCDTGFGIDVEKAIEMLSYESGRNLTTLPVSQPKTVAPSSPVKANSPIKARTTRENCASDHERNASADSNASFEIKPFEPLCDTYPVRQPSLLGSLNRPSFKSLSRMTSKAKAYKVLGLERSNGGSKVLGEETDRPPRVSSLRSIPNNTERPLSQPLPAGQLLMVKMPQRKAKAEKSKLMGIDEEPSSKAMRVLGVDDGETMDRRISPAPGGFAQAKAKSSKRFYEGRLGNLGWSDVGSVK